MKETITIENNPDIASESLPPVNTTLDWVGMSEVELPINFNNSQIFSGKANLFVSLDIPHAKGIHMSRLYLIAKNKFEQNFLSFSMLEELTKEFIVSHSDLSFSSRIEVEFEYLVKRKALVSNEEGWRSYPIKLAVENVKGNINYDFCFTITYSSTCPCSAALARQINAENFRRAFSDKQNIDLESAANWILSSSAKQAVPHAQRSQATIELEFKKLPQNFDIKFWLDQCEDVVQTPVQSAVKRIDEQEFSRLNGVNLMFSEDAARLIKSYLETKSELKNYCVTVEHFESLHAHNAVVVTRKNQVR